MTQPLGKTLRLLAAAGVLISLLPIPRQTAAQSTPPIEPIEIGTRPQLFLDNYIVDNTWTLRYKTQHIDRVFHQPVKHATNPLLLGDIGYACVAYDSEANLFNLWYQTHAFGDDEARTEYAIAYARSHDGLAWERPTLGLHPWKGSTQNNIVLLGRRGRASSPWLLDLPARDKQGYKYVLSYRDRDGTHLVGTNDGIHFDPASDRLIQRLHSDTQNAIVYDPLRDQYVMYCRPKSVYRAFGTEMIDTGESRRIARVANKELWTDWPREAANILLPDELDTKNRYHAFYGMPTTVYGQQFFGFLWPFRWNDRIHTELAWSRDGVHFERHPLRPRLIDYGPPGSWDDEMVFASSWVEASGGRKPPDDSEASDRRKPPEEKASGGREPSAIKASGEREKASGGHKPPEEINKWHIYYAGWDGPHNSRNRTGGLGLATIRREGFVSLSGPQGGGVVCTRVLRWPGGNLLVNASATRGKLTVRISDPNRKIIPGFDHSDCQPFQADSTQAKINWQDADISQLQGKEIRLEFFLQNCDLYSFRATGS